jgi:hypothetical protein
VADDRLLLRRLVPARTNLLPDYKVGDAKVVSNHLNCGF